MNRKPKTLAEFRALGQIPAAACRLEIGPIEFADDAADSEEYSARPISMMARTADAIDHWFFGSVIHDMTGLQLHKSTIPVDYNHDEEIGFLDQFDATDDGLRVSGKLTPTGLDGDPAEKILRRAAAGVPYEASINFAGPMEIEEVDDDEVVQVNGREFAGPGLVIRNWHLRGVAVTPYGADMNTESTFESGDHVPVRFLNSHAKGDTMADTTADTANTDNAAELGETNETIDPRAEVREYVERFGDRGAVWYAEGLSIDDARDRELDELRGENDALRDQVAALKQRLSAPAITGEADPVELTPDASKRKSFIRFADERRAG